ncbi:unnamed protein product [Gulo gulo]|uniref:Uncharacterized protein n=1 Tax=Gulo gulo TaxID=48420 RepID=A0A9X9QAZ9_GULGU|nr:unnamed protein product [Gulo gulo]
MPGFLQNWQITVPLVEPRTDQPSSTRPCGPQSPSPHLAHIEQFLIKN